MRISHVAWNFAGLALPLAMALLAIPPLLGNIGDERFGLLALAWGLIGYASSLDLGIGRALTQVVSKMRGQGNLSAIPEALATASRLTSMSGMVGALLILVAAAFGAHEAVVTTSTSTSEIFYTLLLLSIVLPAQSMSATYRGMCEANLKFEGISVIRACLGVINFGGPLLVSLWSIELQWIVLPLAVSRILALWAFRRLAFASVRNDDIGGSASYSPELARSLFSFGAWVTVSSVVNPVLVQADRFLIAATLSAAAVTVYVVPYEIVVQSLILVGAVSSVIYPNLGRLINERPDEWRRYFGKWTVLISGLMSVVCLLLALMLPGFLSLWLGNNLDVRSVAVGQILCIGVLANTVGTMYTAVLHAAGRADFTAKLHLVELPLYIIALTGFLNLYGIEGAAWAWTARMVFDAIVLASYGSRL